MKMEMIQSGWKIAIASVHALAMNNLLINCMFYLFQELFTKLFILK